MSLRRSDTLRTVISHAKDIAGEVDYDIDSAHLLLALFTVDNSAKSLLADHRVALDDLLVAADEQTIEPDDTVDRVLRRAERIASGAASNEVRCMHLLAALLRIKESAGWETLKVTGIDPSALRPAVMSRAVGPSRGSTSEASSPGRRQTPPARSGGDTASAEKIGQCLSREEAPSSIGVHPALDVDTSPSRPDEETPRSQGQRQSSTTSTSTVTEPTGLDDTPTFQRRNQHQKRTSTGETSVETDTTAEASPADESDTSQSTAQSLADRLFGGEDSISEPPPADEPIEWDDEAGGLDADTGVSLEEHSSDPSIDGASGTTDSGTDRSSTGNSEPSDESTDATSRRAAPDTALGESYALDPDVYPTLSELGRNLTLEAAEGETDPVIGRDDEIVQLIDVLGKRRTNNPLLVGEPGVGKTAIVEGLANRFVELERQNRSVGGRTIIELELGRLLSGTQLRGSFSERLLNIKDEMVAAEGDVIVFLDEIHAWMDAGGSDGADATSELKTALARGQFPCIGATTSDEYREFIEVDPAFDRRFEICRVTEPSAEDTVEILRGLKDQYESHHGIDYDDEALESAVDFSQRYIHDRRLPDKALGLVDLAGSRARRLDANQVDRRRIAEVVSRLRDVPVDRLLRSNQQRFLECAEELGDKIIGQDHVIDAVSEVLQRNYAGFRGERPIGSLLFMGPTGVGKTETVKALADFLFDDRDAIVQIDMSEYMESHAVSRFVGAPPGYVGFDEGGQLTEQIRHRPYQVVLLDEIEKAHRDVLNVLLQVFEEGRLTDGRGRPVDFSNTVIVMTSNLGADLFSAAQQSESGAIGFGASRRPDGPAGNGDCIDEQTREEVLEKARRHFSPELWNRLDERLVFQPLSRDDVAEIAQLQLEESARRLYADSRVDFECGPNVIDHLIDAGGFDPDLGARPMRETIRREVEGMIARAILEGKVDEGDALRLERSGDELTWQKVREPREPAPTLT